MWVWGLRGTKAKEVLAVNRGAGGYFSKAGSSNESQKEVAVMGLVTYLDKSGDRVGSRMTSLMVQRRKNSVEDLRVLSLSGTNHHKLSGVKQHIFSPLCFWRSDNQNISTGMCSLWRF